MSAIIPITPPPPPPRPNSFAGTDAEWKEVHDDIWRRSSIETFAQAQAFPMFRAKRWFQSRTLRFNALVGVVLSTLVAYLGDVKEALGVYGAAGVVLLVVGNAAFRFITDAKISR